MKKIILSLVTIVFTITTFAQIDGISYQAVIIDNNADEIPGVDIVSNNLPNASIDVKFTISGNLGIEYQEIHETSTDDFGMINLMIGQGQLTANSPSSFNQIYWDGNKDLQVEIDFDNGDGYVLFSNQDLTYIPYVRHREIIATSTLDVDGVTNLNNNFTVNNQSPTYLTGDLTVDGLVAFDGPLEVGGDTQLYADLTVDGTTNLNGELYVNNGSSTTLSGDLTVQGESNFHDGTFENLTVNDTSSLNGTLSVEGISEFNRQVTISTDTGISSESNYDAYPLRVEGSQQGIAVRLNPTYPDRSNNYISFWNGNGVARGRIEGNNGLTGIVRSVVINAIGGIPGFDDIIGNNDDSNQNPPNVTANQYFVNDYAFGAYNLTMDYVMAIIRFSINAGAAAGACVTGDCDDAVWSAMDMIVDGIQLQGYITYNELNLGVGFESGGADYAEWLKKYDETEKMFFAEIVGVNGGEVSKKFNVAEKFMVVSQNPMISGAMPNAGEEYKYKKIAFMGQVPVKVIGEVKKGDYILPSGNMDGTGIAVSASKMTIEDYKRIVGVAWSESNGKEVFSYINTAVGINSNDMVGEVAKLQLLLNNIQASLAEVNSSFQPNYFQTDNTINITSNNITTSPSIKKIAHNSLEGIKYKNAKEAMSYIKEFAVKQNFDFSVSPYVKEVLDNPTTENFKKMNEHYSKVLKDLQAVKLR